MKIPKGKTPCPCGSKKSLEACCGPFVFGKQKPDSPEALMRSRYTANVKKAYKYVADSWHSKSKPSKITSGGKTNWLGLEVLNSKQEDNRGWVEFKAFYGHGTHQHALHEKSFFLFEDNQWWYVDGEIIHQDHCGQS